MPFFKTLLFFLLSISLFASSNYSTAVKEKKIYPMGKMIYEKKCQEIDLTLYSSYERLFQSLKDTTLCQRLNPKHLEAVALYLWDVKRVASTHQHFEKLKVSKEEKCPVCGMFLYKYPSWVAKIEYKTKEYYFDGNKDLFKYYFEHKTEIKNILVPDYYTQKTLDATKAFFVIGSDVYGPMGNELIAFETLKSAKKFLLDHKGEKILSFDEINEDMVYSLDD
ncbi:nitrous oxide reductase accessory protein NosL [Sulfurimonas sp. C5]|uniref:nitrous oxide reductase accessory protein NosL n=1 Tax=Sulfurimonas sp. C5 TaxID=3036947 RepID=UPI002456B9CE|nr:nitrous oxide reductase accessory protein NosL [Sulfurimonas sp. C5]MDH4944215.1 nitrous oxide reductase accessory protein NosL [Sulfurimonas sp. C5]